MRSCVPHRTTDRTEHPPVDGLGRGAPPHAIFKRELQARISSSVEQPPSGCELPITGALSDCAISLPLNPSPEPRVWKSIRLRFFASRWYYSPSFLLSECIPSRVDHCACCNDYDSPAACDPITKSEQTTFTTDFHGCDGLHFIHFC
jgi:hypothetical protein